MDAKIEKTTGYMENIARIILSSKTESKKCEKIQKIINELQEKSLTKNLSMNLPAFFNDTCLHLAVRHELVMVVELLINAGIHVNAINKRNRDTALHIAAENGLTRIFLLLCNQPEMDINLLNIDYENVLHICIKKEFFPGINILLTSPFQRIDLYVKNKKNQYPEDLITNINDLKIQQKIKNILFPHYAVLNKDYHSVYKYITKELPINLTWDNGETLLHYAVKKQCFDILLLLCNQKGLQVNIRDKYGRTALDVSVMLCVKSELNRQHYENMPEETHIGLINKIREDRLNVVKILVNSSHKFDTSKIKYFIDYVKDNEKRKAIQEALSYSSIHKKSVQKTVDKGNLFFQEINKNESPLKIPGVDFKKLDKCVLSSEKIQEKNKINAKKIDFEEIMLQEILWDNGLIHEYNALPTEVLPQAFFENIVQNLMLNRQKNKSSIEQLNQEEFIEVTKNIDDNISALTKQFYLVFSVCQGQFQDDCFQLNSHELHQQTIGLLSNFEPYIILRTLMLLTPWFTKNQCLVMHELVKNILFLNPYFGYSSKDKNFKKLFDIFLSKIALNDSVAALSNIRDTLETKRFSMKRKGKKMNNVIDFMQSVIQLINKESGDVSLISQAINIFTMEFYKSCPLSAFNLKSDRYKHLEFYINTFQKLVAYIQYTILENKDKDYKSCARAFSFWVKVAENCLYFPWGPDTNALGLIMSALQGGNISRVRNLFPLDNKTIKIFDGLYTLMSPEKKYALLRKFSEKYTASFPLITLISFDRVMLEEQQLADILSGYGNLYDPIIYLKDKFDGISLKPATNFMQQMMRFAIDEQELYRMSWVIKPNIVDISKENTAANFYNNFIFFQENRMNLTVIENEKVLEGDEALTSIENWLDTLVEKDRMKKDAAEKTKHDCFNYVNKIPEGSPVIKRAQDKKASVRILTGKPSARLLNSLYELPKSPRILDPELSDSSENLSISNTDNSHGGVI